MSYACQQDAEKIEKDLAPALSKAGRAEKPDPRADLWAKWGKEKIKLENGRLVFKNSEHLQAVIVKLFSLDGEESENWAKDLGVKSLYSRLRRTMYTPDMYNVRFKDHPRVYLLLLNDQAEIQYADTIVWYDDKSKHLVVGDQAKLEKVKQKQIRSDVQTNDIIKILQSKSQDVPKTKENLVSTATLMENKRLDHVLTMGAGGYDARYQHQYKAGNFDFKIVCEVYTWAAACDANLTFNTRIKLEYWHGDYGWLPAGEQMVKSMSNVNAYAYFSGYPYVKTSNGSKSATSNYDLDYYLGYQGNGCDDITFSCVGNYYADVPSHNEPAYTPSVSW